MAAKETVLKELQTIPGAGKSIFADLYSPGIRAVRDLKGKSPERFYAVYYSSAKNPEPRFLKGWNWR